MKTEIAEGWSVRVGGSWPYLAYEFHKNRINAEKSCAEKYHRPVKVAIVPLGEYKKLLKGNSEEQ